jgi:outer membrane protein assembly factor BamB
MAWPPRRAVFFALLLGLVVITIRPAAGQQVAVAAAQPAASAKPAEVAVPIALHPLIQEWNKEGYNFWTELKTSLDQKAYADAAVLVFHTLPQVDRGLMPDYRDPDLLLPFATMIGLVMRDNPPLRESLGGQFGKLGRLRLHAAIAAGNVSQIESLAVQFAGTDVACEADRWLGDRWLASGRIAEALGRYQQALPLMAAEEQPSLAARMRLAGAIQGRLIGQPLPSPVALGSRQYDPAVFEAMIAGLRQGRLSRAAEEPVGGMDEPTLGPAPPPGRYEAKPWATLTPDDAWLPGAEKGEKWRPNAGLIWAAGAGGLLIMVGDRGVAALDVSSGQRVWNTEMADSRATAWFLRAAPLKPLVADGRIYLRHWTQRGPGLVCLDLDHGKIVWDLDRDKPAVDPERGKKGWTAPAKDFVASNPLADRGRVLAVTLNMDKSFPERRGKKGKKSPDRRDEPERWTYWQLSLASLDPPSGQVLQRWPIVWVRDPVWGVPACQAVAADDQIVVSVPGVVLAIDRGGSIRWVRRLSVPEVSAEKPWPAPPLLVSGDLALVVDPSGDKIQRLELSCGRRLWEIAPPEGVLRLAGVVGGRLIVEDAAGLTALDTVDGHVAWRHPIEAPLRGLLCGGPGRIMYSCIERDEDGLLHPALAWIDVATGHSTSHPLEKIELPRKGQRLFSLGPIFTVGSRLLATCRDNTPGRKLQGLVELVPVVEASGKK